MSITLIVLFGVGMFCLVVVLLAPARAHGNTTAPDNPTVPEAQPAPLAVTDTDSPAIAEKDTLLAEELSALPYRLPEVRLPRLPEPCLQKRPTLESLMSFPATIVSPVSSPRQIEQVT